MVCLRRRDKTVTQEADPIQNDIEVEQYPASNEEGSMEALAAMEKNGANGTPGSTPRTSEC